MSEPEAIAARGPAAAAAHPHAITLDPAAVVPEVLEVEHRRPPIGRVWLFLLVAGMVLMWAANYVVGKVAVREFPVLFLSGLRIQLAALIMLPMFLAFRGVAGFAVLRREWKLMALLAFFGVVLNQGFFIAGLRYTSIAHSSLIVSLGPVFVLVLARLHGLEELTALKILGMALSLLGTAVLVGERHPGQAPGLLGDLFAAAGTFAFAYYVILGKEMTPRFDSLSLNTFMYLGGALLLLPMTLAGLLQGEELHASWKAWVALLYMSLFSSVIAYMIFYYALHYVSATRMTALSYLQPPLAIMLAFVLLREQITARLVAGALVIFAGVYVTEKG